mmetsp:Transcript_6405/g.8567  ORF Transcript_6405/g.8567 Transcript_6405/m.8567 type:complete len:91 (+) Transcript_6405:1491-1763(+)
MIDTRGGPDDFEDMMMSNDDELGMSGQFSPPHEPEASRDFTSGAKLDGAEMAEIDSPYTSGMEPAPMMHNQDTGGFSDTFAGDSRRNQQQ